MGRLANIGSPPTLHPAQNTALPMVVPDEFFDLVLSATCTLGSAAESASLSLQPSKFGNALVMILKDAVEHGATVRESYVQQVVELLG